MKYLLFIAIVALAWGFVPIVCRRFTHGVAANVKGEAPAKPESTKETLPELKAAIERAEKAEARVVELTARIESVDAERHSAVSEIRRLQGLLNDVPARGELLTSPEAWAAAEVEKFKRNTALNASQADLDPEVREKLSAGLSIEQAVEVISAQRQHDAALSEKQPANPGE